MINLFVKLFFAFPIIFAVVNTNPFHGLADIVQGVYTFGTEAGDHVIDDGLKEFAGGALLPIVGPLDAVYDTYILHQD